MLGEESSSLRHPSKRDMAKSYYAILPVSSVDKVLVALSLRFHVSPSNVLSSPKSILIEPSACNWAKLAYATVNYCSCP